MVDDVVACDDGDDTVVDGVDIGAVVSGVCVVVDVATAVVDDDCGGGGAWFGMRMRDCVRVCACVLLFSCMIVYVLC